MPRPPRAHLFVGGGPLVAAGISGHRLAHALHMLEHRLNAPEAAAGEHHLLLRGRRIRRLAERRRRQRHRGLGRPRAGERDREGAHDQGDASRAAEGTRDRPGLEHGSLLFRVLARGSRSAERKTSGRHFDIRGDRPDCYGRDERTRTRLHGRVTARGRVLRPVRRHARPCAGHPRRNAAANLEDYVTGTAWMDGTSPAMTVKVRQRAPSTAWKRLVSEAEGLSRSAARLTAARP